jgi:1,4-alpha-glucan branching enzyme
MENKALKYYHLAEFDRKMVILNKDFKILEDLSVNRIYENNADKVVAFMRGELLFVFNFNPTASFTDYGIPVKGRFRIVLDTDDPLFGGFNRIDRSTIYLSIRKADRNIVSTPLYLYLYLPSRTALVFRREPVRKATDL